jgi:hypothetical protein
VVGADLVVVGAGAPKKALTSAASGTAPVVTSAYVADFLAQESASPNDYVP